METPRPAPWVACVRVNRHDKAYFLHQLDGFARKPLLVVWKDDRPPAERTAQAGGTAVMATPWKRKLAVPGGHRIRQAWAWLRGAVMRAPLAAGRAETAALMALARRHPPSVIYAHTGFMGLRLAPLAQRLGVPLVVHFHGLDITMTDPVYRRALRAGLSRFDRVMVVGAWMVDRLVDMGCDAGKIDVIPMGAVTGDVPPPPARRDGPAQFVAVGRLVGVKGLDWTIAAFAQVHGQRPATRLHLVGDGPLRGALAAQAADLGLGDAVVFHGQMAGEEALARVAQSDVLVHHALDDPGGPEAFGVVITEAMARGLPVVGTRCGGLPDQIVDGETGLLVDQNDVDGMAEAMARLADDPALRAAMGAAGRARAVKMFDAHVLARRAEEVLGEVAG